MGSVYENKPHNGKWESKPQSAENPGAESKNSVRYNSTSIHWGVPISLSRPKSPH